MSKGKIEVPMEKTITQIIQDCKGASSEKSPKQSTIEIIKQFARAYTFVSAMPMQLSGFNAN